MSAFLLISSAMPSGAGDQEGGAESLFVTLCRLSRSSFEHEATLGLIELERFGGMQFSLTGLFRIVLRNAIKISCYFAIPALRHAEQEPQGRDGGVHRGRRSAPGPHVQLEAPQIFRRGLIRRADA